MREKFLWLIFWGIFLVPAYAQDKGECYYQYENVIQQTAGMVSNPAASVLARKYGLQILNLTWEDTGRYKKSSVGPNISDMTIQVQQKDPYSGSYNLTSLPVIRFPSFSDKTADISPENFYLLAGNETGAELQRVSLRKFLTNLRHYLHEPNSWEGNKNSLLADRDSHVLVSAQACFLPIPKEGAAEFNPVLFNYQSSSEDPAVLTILATREGTSVTVIDNKRDRFQAGQTWGQRLFFNQNGQRASLTGERLTDFLAGTDDTNLPDEKAGLNMVLLIQVPLKQRKPVRHEYALEMFSTSYKKEGKIYSAGSESDVENAVIGHGKVEGPFTEIAGLPIERDPKYPIRVTVQFYKATSNGKVSDNDMRQIAEQINKVYDSADYAGSLVLGGDTGRPTEYIGDKVEPANWWQKFWQRHEENTGQKSNIWPTWRKLFGKKQQPYPAWGLLEQKKE